jgi:hypothetical protein
MSRMPLVVETTTGSTGPGMLFTFLPGSAVGGIGLNTPFYAWASVEEDGQVVAWDYAPDAGWLNDSSAER